MLRRDQGGQVCPQKSVAPAVRGNGGAAPRRRARAEELERRILLAAVSWATDSSGFWDVGANWSTGQPPTAGDDVTIDRGAANPTITVRTTVAAHSLNAAEALAIT